jgi:hypothetical protein
VQRIFTPSGNTVNADVTATPQNITVSISTGDESCRIVNIGSQVVFINWLGAALVSTSLPILPGTAEVIGLQGASVLSVVAAAVGSKVYVTPGSGL